jgi:RimJ/RimL family protein N-acetyltransferase
VSPRYIAAVQEGKMLQGDRVRLRALEPTDEDAIWTWHQDHEFHVLDGWIYPASRGQVAGWLQQLGDPGFRDASFGIENEHGALIGYVRLKRGRAEHRSADFGIAIAREHWDQGYGTDATRTMLRFAFEEMGLHRSAAFAWKGPSARRAGASASGST